MKRLVLFLSLAAGVISCAPQGEILDRAKISGDESIVGGRTVTSNLPESRSTVGLYESKIGYICTGTLVAPNLILTAAHCVDKKAENLYAVFASEIKKAQKGQVRPVDAWVVHPLYSKKMKAKDLGDIAVVRFEGNLPEGYRPAPILWDERGLMEGTATVVAGYGLNWTVGVPMGSGKLRSTVLKIDSPRYSETEAILGQSVRRGICSGDSGGPAYVTRDGELHVWGVASRGDSLPGFLVPKCMLFSVFTRTASYREWIEEAMATLSR